MSSNVKKVDANSVDKNVNLEEDILKLEYELAKHPQVDIELSHLFNGGMYARTMYLPKGCLVTGRVHKTPHFNIIVQGHAVVYVDGDKVKEIIAPAIVPSDAGVKKVILALEDLIWTTIHTCKSTTPDEAVEEVTEPPRPEVLKLLANVHKQLEIEKDTQQ
jgi:hypothetical protein